MKIKIKDKRGGKKETMAKRAEENDTRAARKGERRRGCKREEGWNNVRNKTLQKKLRGKKMKQNAQTRQISR